MTESEIEAALAEFGVRAHRVELVSPLGKKGRRCAFRVDAADGRTLKLRVVSTPADAERLETLRAGLEATFSRVLARWESVLLEEWIEGRMLTDDEAESRAEEAGALLGRLHARPLDAGLSGKIDTRDANARALANVGLLLDAGHLTPGEGDAVRAALARQDPGETRAGINHMDFCAENMLLDTRGGLRVIDNELLEIGASGMDVGRTFDRWPMSAATWERFYRGYQSSSPAPVALRYWQLVATLLGARIRLRTPDRLPSTLTRLRGLL